MLYSFVPKMFRRSALSFAITVLIACNQLLGVADGQTVCVWCNRDLSQKFMQCMYDQLTVSSIFNDVNPEVLKDMQNSLLAASGAMTRTQDDMKMKIMAGAMSGELTGVILGSGDSLAESFQDAMKISEKCYAIATGNSGAEFVFQLSRSVKDMLKDSAPSSSVVIIQEPAQTFNEPINSNQQPQLSITQAQSYQSDPGSLPVPQQSQPETSFSNSFVFPQQPSQTLAIAQSPVLDNGNPGSNAGYFPQNAPLGNGFSNQFIPNTQNGNPLNFQQPSEIASPQYVNYPNNNFNQPFSQSYPLYQQSPDQLLLNQQPSLPTDPVPKYQQPNINTNVPNINQNQPTIFNDPQQFYQQVPFTDYSNPNQFVSNSNAQNANGPQNAINQFGNVPPNNGFIQPNINNNNGNFPVQNTFFNTNPGQYDAVSSPIAPNAGPPLASATSVSVANAATNDQSQPIVGSPYTDPSPGNNGGAQPDPQSPVVSPGNSGVASGQKQYPDYSNVASAVEVSGDQQGVGFPNYNYADPGTGYGSQPNGVISVGTATAAGGQPNTVANGSPGSPLSTGFQNYPYVDPNAAASGVGSQPSAGSQNLVSLASGNGVQPNAGPQNAVYDAAASGDSGSPQSQNFPYADPVSTGGDQSPTNFGFQSPSNAYPKISIGAISGGSPILNDPNNVGTINQPGNGDKQPNPYLGWLKNLVGNKEAPAQQSNGPIESTSSAVAIAQADPSSPQNLNTNPNNVGLVNQPGSFTPLNINDPKNTGVANPQPGTFLPNFLNANPNKYPGAINQPGSVASQVPNTYPTNSFAFAQSGPDAPPNINDKPKGLLTTKPPITTVQPTTQAETTPVATQPSTDSPKTCAMKFAETFYVQLLQDDRFSCAFGNYTPHDLAITAASIAIGEGLSASGYRSYSDEASAYAKKQIDLLPPGATTQAYGEKISKSTMAPLYKYNELTSNCEDKANYIAQNMLNLLPIISDILASANQGPNPPNTASAIAIAQSNQPNQVPDSKNNQPNGNPLLLNSNQAPQTNSVSQSQSFPGPKLSNAGTTSSPINNPQNGQQGPIKRPTKRVRIPLRFPPRKASNTSPNAPTAVAFAQANTGPQSFNQGANQNPNAKNPKNNRPVLIKRKRFPVFRLPSNGNTAPQDSNSSAPYSAVTSANNGPQPPLLASIGQNPPFPGAPGGSNPLFPGAPGGSNPQSQFPNAPNIAVASANTGPVPPPPNTKDNKPNPLLPSFFLPRNGNGKPTIPPNTTPDDSITTTSDGTLTVPDTNQNKGSQPLLGTGPQPQPLLGSPGPQTPGAPVGSKPQSPFPNAPNIAVASANTGPVPPPPNTKDNKPKPLLPSFFMPRNGNGKPTIPPNTTPDDSITTIAQTTGQGSTTVAPTLVTPAVTAPTLLPPSLNGPDAKNPNIVVATATVQNNPGSPTNPNSPDGSDSQPQNQPKPIAPLNGPNSGNPSFVVASATAQNNPDSASDTEDFLKRLMQAGMDSTTDNGFNYNNFMGVVTSVASDMGQNHPEFSPDQSIMKTYLLTIVALSQDLQKSLAPGGNNQANLAPPAPMANQQNNFVPAQTAFASANNFGYNNGPVSPYQYPYSQNFQSSNGYNNAIQPNFNVQAFQGPEVPNSYAVNTQPQQFGFQGGQQQGFMENAGNSYNTNTGGNIHPYFG